MTDDNKTIAQALKEIENKTADRSEIVPLLKSIERNTAKGVSSASTSIGRAVEKAVAKAAIKSEKRQKVSVANRRQLQASTAIVASSKSTKPAKQQASMPGMARKAQHQAKDVNSGRFTASAKQVKHRVDTASSFAAAGKVAQQRQQNQNDKLASILKDAVLKKNDGSVKNTAGKLAFGPFWDIGKELKEAADDMKANAKDEKSTLGRMKNWGKDKLGIGGKGPAKDGSFAASGKGKAQGKAFFGSGKKAVVSGTGGFAAKGTATQSAGGNNGGGGGILDTASNLKDLWQNRKGVSAKPGTFAGRGAAGAARGGGMMARGAGVLRAGAGAAGSLASLAGPLVSGLSLPLIAAGAAAAFGVQQFTKALVTGESDVNNWFKKITGLDAGKVTEKDKADGVAKARANTERVNAERRAQGKEELEIMEDGTGRAKIHAVSGKQEGGVGTVSSGKNDKGGASYGMPQFSSTGGENSQVAKFVQQSQYAKEFDGLKPGSPEYKQKWQEVAKRDPEGFGKAQTAYADKAYLAPQIPLAKKAGLDTNDAGVQAALYSQGIQHSTGGQNAIIRGAQKKLEDKYGAGAAGSASKEEQVQALYDSRQQYVRKVADNRDAEAQQLRAKGKEGEAQKAEGEAKQLRGIARDGGRYTKEAKDAKTLAGQDVRQMAATDKDKIRKPSEKTAVGQKASGAGPATSQVVATEPEKKAEVATAPALPAPDPKAEQSQKIKEAWAKQQGKTLEQAEQQASVLKSTGKDPDEYFKSKLNLDTKQQMGLVGADGKPVAQTATAVAQPTYADKDKAIQDKRSAAIEKINADTTLTDDQKKEKKAEARATAAKETQALQAEDIANNDKINADLDAKSAQGTATVAAPEQQQSATEPATATGTAVVPGSAAASAATGGKTYSKDQVDKAKAESDDLENQRQAILTKAKGAGSVEERDALYKQSDAIKAKREEKDAIVKKDKDESLAAQADTVDFLGNPIGQQAATVPAVSATQPPLPQPQPLQAPPPQPVEVPGIEKLAAANDQKPASADSGSEGKKTSTPNIKTDFDDTMLVLMCYDRT